ncbi:hypothetical protein D3C84_915210 [compost metagenome]
MSAPMSWLVRRCNINWKIAAWVLPVSPRSTRCCMRSLRHEWRESLSPWRSWGSTSIASLLSVWASTFSNCSVWTARRWSCAQPRSRRSTIRTCPTHTASYKPNLPAHANCAEPCWSWCSHAALSVKPKSPANNRYPKCFASTTTLPTCCWCRLCSKTWAPMYWRSTAAMPLSRRCKTSTSTWC